MDDDSLSRCAADFTAQWNQDALAQRHRDASSGAGAGSLGGGEHWIASAVIGAGLFVGLFLVAKVR